MKASWIVTTNDVLANIAVIIGAVWVRMTGTAHTNDVQDTACREGSLLARSVSSPICIHPEFARPGIAALGTCSS